MNEVNSQTDLKVRAPLPLTYLLLSLITLLVVSGCGAAVSASVTSHASSVLVLPEYDRLSSAPVTQDPYETLPKLRYKLAPSAPIVSALADVPGSGNITLRWQQTWLGRGQFSGFFVFATPTVSTQTLPAEARSATFSGLPAGTYTFTVTAIGYYSDTNGLSAAVKLLPTPPPSPVAQVVARPAGCGYLIDVNLTNQSMVASRCGSVFISSPITSGRPGYRSPVGTFYTSGKYQHVWFSYHGLYTPRYVKYAIRFWGLYYLHTWSQPSLSDFGPGSQNGQYASLGCIEMPDNVMAAIYSWAPTGTSVHIHY